MSSIYYDFNSIRRSEIIKRNKGLDNSYILYERVELLTTRCLITQLF
jgi:hypothetical protein